MKPPRVEKALPQDLHALNQISIYAKMHWGYPIEWLHQWMDTLRITRSYLDQNEVFKISTNKVIGFCAIEQKENLYEISHLWILPDYMGKGFGKLLLTESLKQVVKEKSEVVVESDPNSEKFYEKMGFKTFSKKESYPAGRFLPLMKRSYP